MFFEDGRELKSPSSCFIQTFRPTPRLHEQAQKGQEWSRAAASSELQTVTLSVCPFIQEESEQKDYIKYCLI